MATQPTPDIDSINNIVKMAQAMSTLGICADGLTTLEEMKAKVKEELDSSKKKTSWTAGKAFSVLSEIRDEDQRKRRELLNLYSTTLECLNEKGDPRILELLEKTLGTDVKKAIEKHQKQLNVKEYVALVAGETSAGKSSLINLILGEELLPSALLSTTSTIGELRYGPEKRMVVHYKTKDPDTGLEKKEILLLDPSEGKSYIDQISPFVHKKDDRDRGSPFKKVELFWPHKLLKNGIVIVDSPGVGESEIMDMIVTNYLPEAFCFMYVINSTNAGGVQKDRIEKLLQDTENVCRERDRRFLSECALFVCNKWDGVPAQEVNDVKQHIVKRLKLCWPKLDPELQIMYLSTTGAAAAQRLGVISDDFKILIENIKQMVARSVDAKLQNHWKWLYYLLSRVIFHTKAFMRNSTKSKDEAKKKSYVLNQQMADLLTHQEAMIEELRVLLDTKINEVVKKLAEHLSSASVQSRLTTWSDDDAPRKEKTWQSTEACIMNAVKSRFRDEIRHWEIENHVFSDAQELLLSQFSKKLDTMLNQLQECEKVIVCEQSSIEDDRLIKAGGMILIGVALPVWMPVGLVFLALGLPIFGVRAARNAIQERAELRSYESDKSGYLAKKSKEYLAVMTREDMLRPLVKERLKEVQDYLLQIERKIPSIIDGNKILMRHLVVEAVARGEERKFYGPLNRESLRIRDKLSLFVIKDARSSDIPSSNLDWEESASSCLGRGAFGYVYKGKMKKSGEQGSVALKVFNEDLNIDNACQLLAEESILRKLDHPNIVKFHGTTLLVHEGETRIIFVMELCAGNLKSFIEKHPEKTPGRLQNQSKKEMEEIFHTIFKWGIEISDALHYIHEQGIVHRDLKTENILISDENSLKIADVGVSKEVSDVTGTVTGTPIYMAPEVFASKVYTSKADMYSFALILWEMWYGEVVYFDLHQLSLDEFGEKIQDGHRPPITEYTAAPPPVWIDVMTKCWSHNPENRPSAGECREKLSSATHDFGL